MRLKQRYSQLNKEQRAALAAAAGIGTDFLYQIATRWKGKRPSLPVMQKLAQADKKLTLADMVVEFTEPAPDKAAQEAA